MPLVGQLEFLGDDALRSALAALPQRLTRPTVLRMLTDAAEPIRQRMGDLAPRGAQAPHLAEHIAVAPVTKIGGDRVNEGEIAVAIGPSKDVFWGLFQEFGWKFHPAAHPFV